MSALGFAAGNPLAWLPVLALLMLVGNGLRLRARAKALPTLTGAPAGTPTETPAETPMGAPAETPMGAPAELAGRMVTRHWLLAEGVTVDETTGSAAEAYAQRSRLEVVDLVPGDLPVEAAIDLLRLVDPATYTAERLAAGRGSGQAILATEDVLVRADIKAADAMNPVSLLGLSLQLKKYAPAGGGLALAPVLHAAAIGSRRARLAAVGVPASLALTGPLISYAAMAVGTVANPVWGVAALAAFSIQPYLIFAGTPFRPRGLHLAALTRIVRDPLHWIRTALSPRGVVADAEAAKREARIAESRDGYMADIAAGVERYLEPRRDDCPWCGSKDLSHVLSTPDIHQGKPGTFTLEGCGSCGHIFQNPRLTIDGLEFYYRDFYDGCGENTLEVVFGAQAKSYRERAETLKPHTQAPRNWLDVGTGHGHFCTVARDVYPGTVFDGLDMTDSIEEADRRGWVDRGYRGMFPDLADELAGSYDVVSMSHYLEHTREPMAELDAAARVLVPGGHLMIEVPDPEWPLGRILRRFWIPWLQPQHQHLIPIGNLKTAMAERGLVTVGEVRATSRIKFDLSGGLFLLLLPWTRDADVPWKARRPGAFHRIRKGFVTAAAIPFFLLAMLADIAISIPLSPKTGTAYRVVARKAHPAEEA